MDDDSLLEQLEGLERELHQTGVRQDPKRLGELLHDDFMEFGRSGRTHTKSSSIQRIPGEDPVTVWSGNYALKRLGDGAALVTYQSGYTADDGTPHRRTNRSSVWLRGEAGWQVLHHQGTPVGDD